MKYLKTIGLAAVAAMALMAFTVGAASATTLEVNGVTQNGPVTITGKLATSTVATLKTTSGSSENKCKGSHVSGTTSSYTGTSMTGSLEKAAGGSLTFEECENSVVVHKGGTLHITHIAGTTNGTVTSSGAEVTSWSPVFETYLNCKTGTGVHLGTLTGGVLSINAVLNCGFFVPSAQWIGQYTVTTAKGENLAVSA